VSGSTLVKWLLRLLFLLAVTATIIAAFRAYYSQDHAGRDKVLQEIAKVTWQFVLIGVLSVFLKYLLDRHRDDGLAKEQMNRFRASMIRRLVETSHTVRRAPIFVSTDPSNVSYATQMRRIIDAYFELGGIRHEIDNLGEVKNSAFSAWPDVRKRLRAMESYLFKVITEFRARQEGLREQAGGDDRGTDSVLAPDAIKQLPHLQEMLYETYSRPRNSPFFQEFVKPYQLALTAMRADLLKIPTTASPDASEEPPAEQPDSDSSEEDAGD
jgi:hypothetical protein